MNKYLIECVEKLLRNWGTHWISKVVLFQSSLG